MSDPKWAPLFDILQKGNVTLDEWKSISGVIRHDLEYFEVKKDVERLEKTKDGIHAVLKAKGQGRTSKRAHEDNAF